MAGQAALSSADMDLVLDVMEWEGALKGRIDYNTDLFEKAAVARMAGHLQVSHALLC